MQVRAILNADGGTFRGADMDAVSRRLRDAFERAGHGIDVSVVNGDQLIERLEAAGQDAEADVIVAGGGDGTVAAAATAAWRAHKTLAPLPAGTMNLFARAIGLPLDLDAAITALAAGETRQVDVATANGRLFLHQFAIGAQARMVQERRRFGHAGRWTKFVASCRATLNVIRRLPAVSATLDVDGKIDAGRYNYVAVSNNLYGDGHIPYAGRLDGGELGVYRADRLTRWQALTLAKDLMLGAWRDSPHIDGIGAKRVVLEIDPERTSAKATIDGELIDIDQRTELLIHPGALKVIAPARPNE